MDKKMAREEMMGQNFFGVEEATQHFGIDPAKEQLDKLSEVPFNGTVLKECRDSHILVAVFSMSLLDVREVKPSLFYSSTGGWYRNEKFAEKRGEVGWHLVRKTPVPGSILKTWGEQQTLLGKDDEVPSAQVMAYAIIGHYLATGERLFEDIYVRCSDVTSIGSRVTVGSFVRLGLHVSYWWDDRRDHYVGLASSRKF